MNAGRVVFVRGLEVECLIGVHAHEKRRRQRVRVSVELEVAGGDPGDDIAEVVSYDDLVAGVREIAGGRHMHLVETLAARIAERCLGFPPARSVRVTVEKPDILPGTGTVGVVVERGR